MSSPKKEKEEKDMVMKQGGKRLQLFHRESSGVVLESIQSCWHTSGLVVSSVGSGGVTLGVQEMFCLHVFRSGGYDADISGFLSLKQELIVDGRVADSQIVQCLAVCHHYCHQVLGQRTLRPPGLPQAEHHVRLRGVATPLHGVL